MWADENKLPGTVEAIPKNNLLTIPMNYDLYPETEAICLTGKTQVNWIGQLAASETRYMLHIDGKHKIHHGKWMLVSIGTHVLIYKEDRKKITHSYRPLVYMFCKQQESSESSKLICDALKFVSIQFFGHTLKPGVVGMDHSDGFMNGVESAFDDAGIGCVSVFLCTVSDVQQTFDAPYRVTYHSFRTRIESRIATDIITCYPHLKRKAAQGEYLSKQHTFFETFLKIIDAVHLAHSYNMMIFFIGVAGKLIDKYLPREPKLRSFWNSYMCHPWDCWCMGLHLHTPLNIANNQPIESWHKYGTQRPALKCAQCFRYAHRYALDT